MHVFGNFALVAQLAERVFGKDEVSGPIPDEGSEVETHAVAKTVFSNLEILFP